MKRIFALLLSFMFLLVMLAACKGGTDTPSDPQGPGTGNGGGGVVVEDEGPPTFVPPNYVLPEKEADVIRFTADGKRHIIVGTFWDMYYDSTHDDIFANPSVANPETAQMALDRVRYVEEKYDVYIEFKNLTWEGMIESIPISIMSGIPDCDVYLGDTQFVIPAVLNFMATALEDMDIDPDFMADMNAAPGQNVVMEKIKVPGQEKTYMFREANMEVNMYMLGYNRDMIQAHGLTDPQDLYDSGEWTWDVFREYCRVLTDPTQDIYGYSGYWTNFVQNLLFSNDTAFAAGPTQTVDDPKTLEVLDFVHQLYNVDKTARPWNGNDWPINNSLFAEGKSGFWIASQWINDEQFLSPLGNAPHPFDFGMVPFPVGPSGDRDTMATSNTTGNYYFVSRYIKDPGVVFNVMYDLANWYDGDTELRDEGLDWFWDRMISETNTEFYLKTVGRFGFDMMESLGFNPSIPLMLESIDGPAEYTPIQYAETYRQVYQDALDNYFN